MIITDKAMRLLNYIGKILMIMILISLSYITEAYSQVGSLNILVSSDSSKNTNSYSVVFPRTGMGTGQTYSADDWTYENVRIPAYIVLSGNQSLYAARFDLIYDPSKINIQVEKGDLFNESLLETEKTGLSDILVHVSSLTGNVMPSAGKSLVKIYISVIKPGYSQIQISNPDLRFYDQINDIQLSIPATAFAGAVKFYLGDFATSRTEQWTGDGNVNYQDAAVFGQHYGAMTGSALYCKKYDIYPTQNSLDYYSMPEGDGVIDFYDMILFAIGYNYEANGNLLIKAGKGNQMKKIDFILKDITVSGGNKIAIPVYAEGDVRDLKGYSLKILFNDIDFESIEFENRNGISNENIFSHIQSDDKSLTLDVAVLGASYSINTSGKLGEILIKCKGKINKCEFAIISAIAMDSSLGSFLTNIRNNKNE